MKKFNDCNVPSAEELRRVTAVTKDIAERHLADGGAPDTIRRVIAEAINDAFTRLASSHWIHIDKDLSPSERDPMGSLSVSGVYREIVPQHVGEPGPRRGPAYMEAAMKEIDRLLGEMTHSGDV